MTIHTDGPTTPIVHRPQRSGLDRGLTFAQTWALFAVVYAALISFMLCPLLLAVVITVIAAAVLAGVILIPVYGRTLWEWAELRYWSWRERGSVDSGWFLATDCERRDGAPYGVITTGGGRPTVALSVRLPGARPGTRWLTRQHCDELAHAGVMCGASHASVVIEPDGSSSCTDPVRVTYAFAPRGGATGGNRQTQAGEIGRRLPTIIAGAAHAGLELTALTAEQHTAILDDAYRVPPHARGEDCPGLQHESQLTWDHLVHNAHRSVTCESVARGVGQFPDVLPHLRSGWEQARVALLYRFDRPAQTIVDQDYRSALIRHRRGRIDAAAQARSAVAAGAAVAQVRTFLTVTVRADDPLPDTDGRALRCWYAQQASAFRAALGLTHPASSRHVHTTFIRR